MASTNRSLFQEHWLGALGQSNTHAFYARAKASLDLIQRMKVESKLEVHNGCVNTICWNEVGNWILSGSDDQRLCITNPFTREPVANIQSGHFANIFSAKFLPNTSDNQVVSCSGDGMIHYTIVDRKDQHGQHPFECHFGTTYELVTVPQDCHTFLSCGEDGTVRWFDLRIKDKCLKDECKEDILINCRRAVTALAINPMRPYQLSVGCSDSTVRIFDRRMLGTRATGNYTGRSSVTGMVSRFTAPLLEGHPHRITSLSYSTDGAEVLASFSSEQIYLFNLLEDGRKKFQADYTKTSHEKGAGTTDASASSSPRHPPIKRLRLRGDWSDTGPNARPERERGSSQQRDSGPEGQPAPEAEDNQEAGVANAAAAAAAPGGAPAGAGNEPRSVTIMQRMSDMLTRWLQGAARQADQPGNESQRNNDEENQPLQPPQAQDAEPASNNESPDGSGEAGEAVLEGGGAEEGTSAATAITSSQSENTAVKMNVEQSSDLASPDGTADESAISLTFDTKEGAMQANDNNAPGTQQNASCVSAGKPSGSNVVQGSGQGGTSRATGQGGTSRATEHQRNQNEENQNDSVIENETVVEDTVAEASDQEQCENNSNNDSITNDLVQSQSSGDGVAGDDGGVSSGGAGCVGSGVGCGARVVEPLVSLRYTPEGTSSGTITVDFPESGTEAGPNLPPDLSDYRNPAKEAARISPATSRSSSQERKRKPISREGSTSGRSTPAAGGNTSVVKKLSSGKTGSSSSTSSPCSASDKPSQSQSQDAQISQSHDPPENVDSNEPTIAHTENEESHNLADDDAATGGEERPDRDHVMKYCPTDESSEPSPTQEEAGESSRPAHPDPPGGGTDMPRRLAGQGGRATNPGGSRQTVPLGRGGRQRRHGHSGPPTGDFQLHSASDNDSDDELAEAAQRRDRDDIERNLAALRLQELYRKRQDEREREEQQLLNIHQPALKHVYSGHRNARTMIKEATFWGDEFVMSGSDCGHIFIWDRYTSELVMVLEGDKHVVNCLQPHPYDPVLASSGIDYDIKLWMPTEDAPNFDREKAGEVVSRNRVMLEETRDTITVPASFMLRMLASLNHIRSGRRQGEADGTSSSSSDDD